MGTVIELITNESVTVREDLLTVQKTLKEGQFMSLTRKHPPYHTLIINREAIALIKSETE